MLFNQPDNPKLSLPARDIDPHLTHGSLDPQESTIQSTGLTNVATDRQTDRQTTLLRHI